MSLVVNAALLWVENGFGINLEASNASLPLQWHSEWQILSWNMPLLVSVDIVLDNWGSNMDGVTNRDTGVHNYWFWDNDIASEKSRTMENAQLFVSSGNCYYVISHKYLKHSKYAWMTRTLCPHRWAAFETILQTKRGNRWFIQIWNGAWSLWTMFIEGFDDCVLTTRWLLRIDWNGQCSQSPWRITERSASEQIVLNLLRSKI